MGRFTTVNNKAGQNNQVADFLRRELGIWVRELLTMKFEMARKYVALHQSARPPFD
jgi:hypothetical protein